MHVSFQYSHFDVAKQGALGHIAHLHNNNSQLWLYIVYMQLLFYCIFKTAIQSEILSLPKSVLSKSHHCQENFAHRIVHLT